LHDSSFLQKKLFYLAINYFFISFFTEVDKQRFPDAANGDINQAIRQKCSNAVKALKLQELQQLEKRSTE